MTKLFKEIFILLLCFFLIIGFVEYKLKNTKPIIVQLIENVDSTKKIILIGNSHIGAIMNIDDTFFNKISANLSQAELKLNDRYRMLKYVFERNKIKTIYFGLDYNQIGEELSNSVFDKQLYSIDHKLFNNEIGNVLLSHIKYFSLNINPPQLISILFNKNNSIQNNGFIPPSNKLKTDNVACQKRAYEHSKMTYDKNKMTECLNELNKIIDLCKKNNVQLIIINPPKTKCFTENYLNENMLLAKEKINELCKINNIKYLDFMNDTSFIDDDFADFDHFNKEGANKFVKKLQLNIIEK